MVPNCPLLHCPLLQKCSRLDRQQGSYSVSRRSRRWWLRIFYFTLDCSIVNAYILHSSLHPEDSVTMFQFWVLLVGALLCNYSSRDRWSNLSGQHFVRRHSTHKAVMQKNPGVPDEVRLKSVGVHMPQALDSFHRYRLRSSQENNKCSKIQCDTCGVALCITPCFTDIHSHYTNTDWILFVCICCSEWEHCLQQAVATILPHMYCDSRAVAFLLPHVTFFANFYE